MSLGSLSPEAHQTITQAMNMIGGRSNTGEGGEDSDVYRQTHTALALSTDQHGSSQIGSSGGVLVAPASAEQATVTISLNNKIKQIASGRFGVTAAYLAHAEEIEIKVAQGAKPGEGGQLPGFKVSGLIARLRHAQPGVSLISPPPHHDIYSIEDLAQLIFDLKRLNPKAAVGVKLVSSCGVGTVAAGVAKAYADYVVIAGNTGGTGAAALSSIKYAGNPWELGLAEAQQVLMRNGMRGRVRLRTDGGLATARDVLIAALLGADEYAFGTAVLVAIGCDMARQCHLNTCPTGIATQKPELRAKFRGKPEHIAHFFEQIAEDLRQLLADNGFATIAEAIGRVDLLTQIRFDGNVDLHALLARGDGTRSWAGIRNDQPVAHIPIDESWVQPAISAAERSEPFTIRSMVTNRDRAIGARLAGELALRRAQEDLPARFTAILDGVAGQSFGAFAVDGMELILEGAANDFVGKGLCGGELVLRARGLAAENSEQHVILGNVALYGATSGMLFAAGRTGERFAVRNSGALAVVEGVGDHGCEYMTGGLGCGPGHGRSQLRCRHDRGASLGLRRGRLVCLRAALSSGVPEGGALRRSRRRCASGASGSGPSPCGTFRQSIRGAPARRLAEGGNSLCSSDALTTGVNNGAVGSLAGAVLEAGRHGTMRSVAGQHRKRSRPGRKAGLCFISRL